MGLRIQIVAILATVCLLVIVLELVRRRRLLERYALLWVASAAILLLLAVWRDLLAELASSIGVAYPPTALFVVAFLFVLVLLLHFSVAVSRLADQSKVLAQRVALLEERLRHAERPARGGEDRLRHGAAGSEDERFEQGVEPAGALRRR